MRAEKHRLCKGAESCLVEVARMPKRLVSNAMAPRGTEAERKTQRHAARFLVGPKLRPRR